MTFMRVLYVAVPLFALLAFSVWFAAVAWERLGGETIPAYGYVAIGRIIFTAGRGRPDGAGLLQQSPRL